MNSIQSIQAHNFYRTYLYMTILMIIFVSLGHLASQALGLGLTGTGTFLIIAGLINFVAYFFSHKIVLWGTGAKPLSEEMLPEYYQVVRELTHQAQLPMPKLYYIDTDAMNAFATGRDHNHSVVVATRGLIEKLTPQETKAVIAHELTHIQNYDMRLMAITSIVVGCISIAADLFWHSQIISKASEKDNSGYINMFGMILSIFAPLTAFFIQLAISRKREFLADAQAALWIGNPQHMISALDKIDRDRVALPHTGPSLSPLFFNNPEKAYSWLDNLFSTHPSIDERIQALGGKRNTGADQN